MQRQRLQALFSCGDIIASQQIVKKDPEPHQGGHARIGPDKLLLDQIAFQPVGHFMARGFGLQAK
ncbi:hypothetical protein D3C75_1371770 [compost metagenome]